MKNLETCLPTKFFQKKLTQKAFLAYNIFGRQDRYDSYGGNRFQLK